jgi:hypothetical protein
MSKSKVSDEISITVPVEVYNAVLKSRVEKARRDHRKKYLKKDWFKGIAGRNEKALIEKAISDFCSVLLGEE